MHRTESNTYVYYDGDINGLITKQCVKHTETNVWSHVHLTRRKSAFWNKLTKCWKPGTSAHTMPLNLLITMFQTVMTKVRTDRNLLDKMADATLDHLQCCQLCGHHLLTAHNVHVLLPTEKYQRLRINHVNKKEENMTRLSPRLGIWHECNFRVTSSRSSVL